MADLRVGIVVSAIDRITRPMRGIVASTGRTAASLKKFETQRAGVKSLAGLQSRLGSTAQKMHAVKLRTAALGRQLAATANPSKKLRKQFESARKTSDGLRRSHREQKQELGRLRTSLREAGVDTRRLTREQGRLDDQIGRLNRKLARQQRALKQWGKFKSRLPGLARQGAVGIGLLGVATELFRRTFVTTASDFERYQTILETVEGSSIKAKRSMDWISRFAVKTPFELDQVTDAFVKLRAYGLDPTDGLLRSLGDTASAMGKPIMQAVEAIADAVTGENERLKEFGVKARTKGDTITYEYTVKGETKTVQADARNRAEIQKVLTGIFDSKFAGAMGKQSKTFAGMLSNLGDQWTRFQLLVMKSGVFDFVKGKLSGLLGRIDKMAASGELQKLAEQMGGKLMRAFEAAWSFGERAIPVMERLFSTLSGIASAVGGWERLAAILIGLKVASVLSPLVSMGAALSGLSESKGAGKLAGWLKTLGLRLLPLLGKGLVIAMGALKTLSLFMLTNPIGLAITGIAVAAVLIWKYWEPIKGFFKGVWQGVKTYTAAFWEWLKSTTSAVWEGIKYLFLNFHPLGILISNWEPVKGFFKGLWTGVKTAFSEAWTGIEEWWKSFSFLEFGKNLMRTLADGILAAPGAVWNALKSALGAVGRLLPSSDAREGPLSRLTASGRSILGTLGQGIRQVGADPLRRPLARALGTAAAGLALSLPVSPAAPALKPPVVAAPKAELSSFSAPAAPGPTAPTSVSPVVKLPSIAAPKVEIPSFAAPAAPGPTAPTSVSPVVKLPSIAAPKVEIPSFAAPAAPRPTAPVSVEPPALSPASGQQAPSPNRSVVVNNHYRITISQQPGEDPQSLADRIIREIEQRQGRSRREELFDEVGD